MRFGVPKEIKPQENRIGLTPESVRQLVNHGHQVLVEDQAGFGAGFENSDYENVGAKILKEASDIFNDADLIIKVKEPLQKEVEMLRENQILFTYLHLAAAPELTRQQVKTQPNRQWQYLIINSTLPGVKLMQTTGHKFESSHTMEAVGVLWMEIMQRRELTRITRKMLHFRT